jgi:hypothetical protein
MLTYREHFDSEQIEYDRSSQSENLLRAKLKRVTSSSLAACTRAQKNYQTVHNNVNELKNKLRIEMPSQNYAALVM